jgi:glycosyltransferase involved in cell wall biosynthesis
MRIGISTSVIQRGKTGVAQYLLALLRALASSPSGHKFVLFVLEEDLPLFASFNHEVIEFVSVEERFRPPVKNIVWHQSRLPALVRKHRLDVLHVPSYRRMVWRRPCLLVATIHDLAPFRVPKKYDWKRMLYGRIVARRLAMRQDKIIAISENTAGDIAAFFGVPRPKISVIYNGIDHERFNCVSRESDRTLAQQYRVERPFFLYVARLEHPGKNHVRLISAFEKSKAATHSNWKLAFAGSDWLGAEAIHTAIGKSPCAAHIHCLGFVPDKQLPDLYRAADIFVYPSLYEGFGMPPLEAMACGCPVIASPNGSLREVLGSAAAMIDPEDIHSITRELYVLGTDSSARNRFRAAGLAHARKFDWAVTAAQTLKVYEAAAAERG